MMGLWIGFLVMILALLALDLGVFHRKTREVPLKEALGWVAFWVSLALAFNVFVYFIYQYELFGASSLIEADHSGRQVALKFFTGYLVEISLSTDNIFVFLLIFNYFQVPLKYQHRVLFWGILTAIVLRGVMIGFGVTLLNHFQWMFYVFGGLLIATAARMPAQESRDFDPERNLFVKGVRKLFPVTMTFDGEKFFTRREGRWMATPLVLALLLVETSDIVFAVDSIPAILSITRDSFLVYTSNIFAILGLRSMYFALAAVVSRFRYLKVCLTFILAFIGIKMILTHHYHIPIEVSLGVIGGILALGVAASFLDRRGVEAQLLDSLAGQFHYIMHMTYRGGRRLVVFVIGVTVVLIGVVFIFTPGPALVVIPTGIGILALEFTWAKWLLRRLRDNIKGMSGNLPESLRKKLNWEDGPNEK